MSIPNRSLDESKSSLLPPTYSSSFWTAAKASNYPILPTPSPALESASILSKNHNPSMSNQSSSQSSQSSPDSNDSHQTILFTYPEPIRAYRTSINSLAASVFAVAFGFPLDSVKTRLQTYKYNGNWHCIIDTYKNEGIMGFYRGLTAPLVRYFIRFVPIVTFIYYHHYALLYPLLTRATDFLLINEIMVNVHLYLLKTLHIRLLVSIL